MADPLQEQQSAAEGPTFGKAAAEDEELVDELLDETEGDAGAAEQRFEERSAEDQIRGAHPPADADDRTGEARSFRRPD